MLNLFSCYDDIVINDEIKLLAKNHPPVYISADIVGSIHDENGNNLTGLTEKINNQNYFTTNSGYYHFEVHDVNKNNTILSIFDKKVQYEFSVKPIENEINYFCHTIISHPLEENFSSDENSVINFDKDIELDIEANSYTISNTDYTGEVMMKYFILDLTDPIHLESLPGGHLAKDNNGNDVWLDYKKAIYFDLFTNGGDKLNLKKNKGTLSVNNSDCDDCQIWYYDPEQNVWVESGFSNIPVLQGGFYCLANSYVYNLVTGNAFAGKKPLMNQAVDFYLNDKLIQRVYTTNTGKWFTHLPIDKDYIVKMNIFSEDVFEIKFNIGEDDTTIIPGFDIGDNVISFFKLNGEIRNCENKPETNNFLVLNQEDCKKYFYVDDSKISLNIPNNKNKILDILVADELWKNTGVSEKYYIVENNVNFSKIFSCNEISQDGYFDISIDGNEKLFVTTEAKWVDGRTKITVYDLKNAEMILELYFSGKNARKYNDAELNIYFDNLIIDDKKYEINCLNSNDGCGFEYFEIESYGERKNDWIKGRFKGKFWIKSYNPLSASYKTINAAFLVRRVFR